MENCWYNGLELFEMIDSLTVIEEWQKGIIKGEIESMSFLGIPKGHGRLIDADNYRKEMLDSREFDFFKRLDMQPTIIEADKEESEDKE